MKNFNNKSPRVSLVGAGPGSIDLITVRGLRAIQTADAILYDALVDEELLNEATTDCVKVFVGKRAGIPCKKQEEINLLLLQHALNYGYVVRLKGGDPFIFGRGYEELEYLRAFDIPVDVIPGISSSTSLPLLQGVPLTSRGVSESFWVLTGSTQDHLLSEDIALAMTTTATLVILMAIRKLDIIANMVIKNRSKETPMMIIENGATEKERMILGSAGEIVEKAIKAGVSTPGIIVVGEVVALHPEYIKSRVLSQQLL